MYRLEDKIVYAIGSKRKYRNKHKSLYHFPQSQINYVSFSVPLSKVIGDYVSLKRNLNGRFKGKCPFCREMTSSYYLLISDKRKVFKCFNCGISGRTAVQFVAKYFNCSFEKALRFVNQNYLDKPINLIATVTKVGNNVSGNSLPF